MTPTVDGHEIKVSHREKLFFADAGVTKGGLVDYYARIAPHMRPLLDGHPLAMHRYPDGIDADGFLQKEAPAGLPGWVTTAAMPKQSGTVHQVVADNEATLVELANLGCVSLHALLSRADRPHHPDEMIIDLDPGEERSTVPFAATAVRDLLDELGLPTYAKSTGSRGIHVHVPLDRSADFDTTHTLSAEITHVLATRHPDRLTTALRIADRRGRLFLDTLRNGYAQLAVAPYSLRARPEAPIAIPIDWNEATSADFDPRRITIANVFRRLAQKDDPWRGMRQAATSLRGAQARLEELARG